MSATGTRDVLISCEHASSHVPAKWSDVINPADPVLSSHEGLDIGAAELASDIHRYLGGTLMLAGQSRLLIDLNRSAHNYRRFSRFSRTLQRARKKALQETFHDPYWAEIRNVLARHPALFHLSVHSFTPTWNGARRSTDIGLLPLTSAADVRQLAHRWKPLLRAALPDLRVHINQPYTGNQDGLIRQLMIQRPDSGYLGIEIEVSQGIIAARKEALATAIASSVCELVMLTPPSSPASPSFGASLVNG